MPVSIIIGGQYGSEGKGKIADFWAKKMNASAVVRVGGPNSGHTVYTAEGKRMAFTQIPAPCARGDAYQSFLLVRISTSKHSKRKLQRQI